MEDPAATHDDLAETGGPEPDPFAEIPSDPLTGPPTEGPIDVQEGDLRQYAVEEAQAGGGEPAAEEPEFLEEPPETETGEPVAEEPQEPTPEPEPEPAPPAEPEPPAEEPAAEPEPEEPQPEPSPPEPEPAPEGEPEPAPTEGAGGDPATPVEGSGIPPSGESLGSEETPGEPEPGTPPEEPPVQEEPAAAGGEPEPGETPEPEKPKAKRRKRRSRKKEVPGRRGYVILKVGDVTWQRPERPIWEEAFERDIPIGEDGSEPVVIDARSGELALRNAYRQLTDNGEGSFTLVAVPQKLFKPKAVEGKVPETALAIKVG